MEKKDNDMIPITAYIRTDQHTALKRIYAETGARITDSIRKAIDVFLKKGSK